MEEFDSLNTFISWLDDEEDRHSDLRIEAFARGKHEDIGWEGAAQQQRNHVFFGDELLSQLKAARTALIVRNALLEFVREAKESL